MATDRDVQLTGRVMYEYFMGRFNMTSDEAIATMRKHNQDLSWLVDGKVPE
jgi:plasmid maintenance system antidote protein VapI